LRNTFGDIEEMTRRLGPHEVKFEHEIYGIAHLYNLTGSAWIRVLFNAPNFPRFVMGILGLSGADLDNLVFLKRTADRLSAIPTAGRCWTLARRTCRSPRPRCSLRANPPAKSSRQSTFSTLGRGANAGGD
jgi:uncharacterized protein (DUF849 family)